jgi:lysophospholipase L1-like esterase
MSRKSLSTMVRSVCQILALSTFSPFASAGETKAINSCRLILPPVVYAVVGVEMNLYFRNLILTPPGRVWIFDVTCAKGRQQVERWTWIPKAEDAGDLPLSLEVRDANDKVVANGKTTIRVASAKAGAGQPLRLLCIGDSGTHASVYTAELMKSCAGPEQPRLTLIGTHHPSFAVAGNVHEGYGGWTFQNFVEKYTDKPVPGDHANRSSPFVFGSPHGAVFDVPRYVKESCGGVPPDYVTMFLGANELAGIVMDERNPDLVESIERVLGHADRLIAGWQAAAPKAKIGLVTMYPPTNQDGFGANYPGSRLKYWPYRKAQHQLVEMMIAKYANRVNDGLYVIPAYVNLDTEHAFPIELQPANARTTEKVPRIVNALHLTASGYGQLSDAIFGWLKCMVQQSKK